MFNALTKLIVGEMDQGARFAKLFGDIGLVLRVAAFNEHAKFFSQ